MEDKRNEVIDHIRKQIIEEETESYNFALPSLLSKKVMTYMSMREDLILCSKTVVELTALLEQDEKVQHILTALWTSMIIVYSKCFTDARHAKKSKVEIKELIDPSRKDLLDFHNVIMEIRHTFIAHRGETENEQAIVYFKQPKIDNGENKTEYQIKSLRANNFGTHNLALTKELFEKVLLAIEKKLFKEVEKLHNHISTSYTPDQIKEWLIK